MIHIVNPQTSEILDYITLDNIIEDTHKKSLESYIETYDAIVLGGNNFSYDEHLEKRNHIIIPDEDGTYQEFILFEVDKYRDTEGRKTHFYAHATYLELKKAKVIYPTRLEGLTLSQHAGWALNDTGWRVGIVEAEGVRTFNIENHTNPYEFLKRISREFEVELRFRVEHDGQRVTGRYVDLLERVGEWRGREIEFGKDLDGIRRVEKQDIVTALLGLGPEREDGTRLEVLVEDEEALQRWGRVDEHGNLHHLIEPYEIQSERQEMSEEEARRYTRTALDKRINTQVTYETTVLDLEEVPGLENKQIRFGDMIRIKDTHFNPPLYLEARVFEIERSIKSKAKKDIKLGDYVEYTEEEIDAIWRQLQNEIRRRLDRLAIVSINSTAGNVFKNAQGETELTARTFVGGAERDEDGTLYDYQWMRFDKDGNHDTDFYAEGKTIAVKASDIDEKATYRVLVAYELEVINTAEITISNVFDGEDGEPGPPGPKGDKGEDGKTFYTWVKYADTPTSGMSDSPEGKEYIGIAYNKETPTPSTNYADYVWSKFKGDQGIPGPPGKDGQPTYTWVKYADDEHGNGMSDSPDGKLYIGLAFNKTTPEESNNPADYTWSLMPQNIEVSGRNIVSNQSLSMGRATQEGYIFRLTRSGSGTNPFLRVSRDYFELDTKYVASFKVRKVSGTVFSMAGHSVSFRGMTEEVYRDGIKIDTPTWSTGDQNYPDDTETHEYVVYFKTPKQWPEDTAPYWYIQPNRSAYGQDYVLEIWDFQIEKGDMKTGWSPAPEDVQEQIDEAKQEAQQAQTTADGKNSVFTQSTAPPTTGRKIGDVWFDTSRDNLMHRFDGTQWVEAKWGERSLAAESVTALHIKSLEGLNVNDQFVVDSQGNVKFAGHLEGATGVFEGTLKTSENIEVGNLVKVAYTLDGTSGVLFIGPEEEVYGKIEYRTGGNMHIVTTELGRIIFDAAGVSAPYLDVTNDLWVWGNIQVPEGQVKITRRSVSGGLALSGVSGDHIIVGHNTTGVFHIYPHRESGENIFTIRSHENRSNYRNDFIIESEGTIVSHPTRLNEISASANVHIGTSTGRLFRSTSTRRAKLAIENISSNPYNILNLEPRDWYDKTLVEEYENALNRKYDNGEEVDFDELEPLQRIPGLIAEEVEEAGLEQFVEYDRNGKIVGLQYDRLWILLIPIVKDLHLENKNLNQKVSLLESKIQELESKIEN